MSTFGERRRRSCRSETTRSTPRSPQLVVHFMSDPVAGLREMARVDAARRPGRGMRLGSGGRSRTARRRSGGLRVSSIPTSATNHGWPAAARAISGSSCARRGCATSRTARSRSVSRPELRGVVGAVHVRRRAGRRVRGAARCGSARAAAGTVSRAAPGTAVHGDREGMVGTGDRVVPPIASEVRPRLPPMGAAQDRARPISHGSPE